MGNLLLDVLMSTWHAWPAFNLADIRSLSLQDRHVLLYMLHSAESCVNMLVSMQPIVDE